MGTPRPDSTPMSDARPYRCLLVEDVAAMRALLRAVLQATGCEFIEAESVHDARRILRSNATSPIDFAVLDLELPDGSGLDLMPEFGAMTRVIALTADETRETSLQCLNAGCDAVLSKSGQLSELKNLLMAPKVHEPLARPADPELRASYLEYLTQTRLELEEALDAADLLAVRRIAHRLRGTAVHFGHPGVSRAAKSVTVAIATGCLDGVKPETVALSASISDALEAHHVIQRSRSNAVPPGSLFDETGPESSAACRPGCVSRTEH